MEETEERFHRMPQKIGVGASGLGRCTCTGNVVAVDFRLEEDGSYHEELVCSGCGAAFSASGKT